MGTGLQMGGPRTSQADQRRQRPKVRGKGVSEVSEAGRPRQTHAPLERTHHIKKERWSGRWKEPQKDRKC